MSDLPQVIADLARWYALMGLGLGERTGLTDALLSGIGTAQELARRAGVDGDNARLWADLMVVSGYATVAEGTGGDSGSPAQFEANESTLGILRRTLPFDLRSALEIAVPIAGLMPRIERAIRDGGGIASDELQAALGPIPERVNVPTYDKYLLDDWIPAHPELEAALRAGADVVEIGPGGGGALRLLAAAFPASRFLGCDLDPLQVARANAAAQAASLVNLRFEARDAALLPDASADIVAIFDAFHHFTDPDGVLAGLRRALRPGGCLLMAEPALTGDPAMDAADTFATITYGASLFYCFQESKTPGRPGMGSTWGGGHLLGFLEDGGFRIVRAYVSDGGYDVVQAVPTGD